MSEALEIPRFMEPGTPEYLEAQMRRNLRLGQLANAEEAEAARQRALLRKRERMLRKKIGQRRRLTFLVVAAALSIILPVTAASSNNNRSDTNEMPEPPQYPYHEFSDQSEDETENPIHIYYINSDNNHEDEEDLENTEKIEDILKLENFADHTEQAYDDTHETKPFLDDFATLDGDALNTNFQTFKTNSNQLYGENPEEKIWNLLHYQIGCSAEQSAALMGNMAVESPNYNPFQPQIGGGDGVGLFQYSGSRAENFLKFVNESPEYASLYPTFLECANSDNYEIPQNLSTETVDLGIICNVDFLLCYEQSDQTTDATYNRNQLNSAFANRQTTESMTIGFMEQVERTPNGKEKRVEEAQRIFEKYANDTIIY